jgi:Arc/MetJ family transcription regulator
MLMADHMREIMMRTTLTLDDDVIDKAKAVAAKRHLSFRAVVNEALRIGLEEVEKPATQRSYQTEPHAMGLRTGYNLNNIQELLAQAEGEDFK